MRHRQAGGVSLGNQVHVLLCLRTDPTLRIRDLAHRVGITERTAQKIVTDLESAGLIERVRMGRRNHYRLFLDAPLDPRLDSSNNVQELIEWLSRKNERSAKGKTSD